MFIYKNIIDNTEHIALVKGKINKEKDILVRMHSLNIFSDLLNQKKHNLDKAIDIISKNENGIIVIVLVEFIFISRKFSIIFSILSNNG